MKTSFHPLAPAALLAVAAVVFAACVGWQGTQNAEPLEKALNRNRIVIIGGKAGARILPANGPTTLLKVLTDGGFWPLNFRDLERVQVRQTNKDRTDEVFTVTERAKDDEAGGLLVYPGAVIYVPEPTIDAALVLFPKGQARWLHEEYVADLKKDSDETKDRFVTDYRGLLSDPGSVVRAWSRPAGRLSPGDIQAGDVLVVTVAEVKQNPTLPVPDVEDHLDPGAKPVAILGDVGKIRKIAGCIRLLPDCLTAAGIGHDSTVRTTIATGGLGFYWDGPEQPRPVRRQNPGEAKEAVLPGDTLVICRPPPIVAEVYPDGTLWVHASVALTSLGSYTNQDCNIIHGVLGSRAQNGAAPDLVKATELSAKSGSPLGPGDLVIKFVKKGI